ncbi:MAG TPA: peptidoglycan recognition family protein [Fimbriimonas sp.]
MRILNPAWLPNCRMSRIITHWTAGEHKCSALDKAHYHFLIEDDGRVVKGTHSIADNVATNDGNYAAHTLRCNTGSIGVGVCCMAGAKEKPFHAGKCAMNIVQWETMATVVAELCDRYQIPVTPYTVLGHGEVQTNLGIGQLGKWDPMVLPWDLNRPPLEVGNAFRDLVRSKMAPAPEPPEESRPQVKIQIEGEEYDGILDDGTSFVRLRTVAGSLGWTIARLEGDKADVLVGDKVHTLDFINEKGIGYAETRDIAAILGRPISWKPSRRLVVVG